MVYTDSIVNKSANHGSNPVVGDALVLCGASCYSISNSFAEYVVKHYNQMEIFTDDGFIWIYYNIGSRIDLGV